MDEVKDKIIENLKQVYDPEISIMYTISD